MKNEDEQISDLTLTIMWCACFSTWVRKSMKTSLHIGFETATNAFIGQFFDLIQNFIAFKIDWTFKNNLFVSNWENTLGAPSLQ